MSRHQWRNVTDGWRCRACGLTLPNGYQFGLPLIGCIGSLNATFTPEEPT